MAELEFTWNPAKAAANKRKHRVSFGEAQTVFYDDEALLQEAFECSSSFIRTKTGTTLSESSPPAKPLPLSV